MNQFFSMLDHALDLGRSFVLAGIVSSSGSAPRSSGAKMAVFENGETAGTVGGGRCGNMPVSGRHWTILERRHPGPGPFP